VVRQQPYEATVANPLDDFLGLRLVNIHPVHSIAGVFFSLACVAIRENVAPSAAIDRHGGGRMAGMGFRHDPNTLWPTSLADWLVLLMLAARNGKGDILIIDTTK